MAPPLLGKRLGLPVLFIVPYNIYKAYFFCKERDRLDHVKLQPSAVWCNMVNMLVESWVTVIGFLHRLGPFINVSDSSTALL